MDKAPALAASAGLKRLAPLSVQSVGGQSAPYLTHLVPFEGALACVSDDSTVTLLDLGSGATLSSSRPFASSITQAKASPTPHLLLASLRDGTIGGLDLRSGARTLTLRGPRTAPYTSLAARGHLICAGSELSGVDASIDVFDARSTAAPLFRYTESHSDDVTALHFHPARDDMLLSGSTDGLLCALDVSMADEDDAVIAVANTGSSVAKAGWRGGSRYAWADVPLSTPDESLRLDEDARRAQLGTVWALGDMQSLSVWDADKFDPLQPPLDTRTSTSLSPPWSSDYMIDTTATDDGITLFAGANDGAFAMIGIQPSAPYWSLETLFPAGAHTDIVRCVEAVDGRLWTGGEDGRLCVWSMDNEAQPTQPIQTFDMSSPSGGGGGGGGESRRGPHSSRNQRWKPYG